MAKRMAARQASPNVLLIGFEISHFLRAISYFLIHSFIIIERISFASKDPSFSVILIPLFGILNPFGFLFSAFRATSWALKIQGQETRLFRRTKDKRLPTLNTHKGLIIHGKYKQWTGFECKK